MSYENLVKSLQGERRIDLLISTQDEIANLVRYCRNLGNPRDANGRCLVCSGVLQHVKKCPLDRIRQMVMALDEKAETFPRGVPSERVSVPGGSSSPGNRQ
jgi:hypothetical protein